MYLLVCNNNNILSFIFLSTKWVDYVEEPMKYKAFLSLFGTMGGWLEGSWGVHGWVLGGCLCGGGGVGGVLVRGLWVCG